jgi:hypothetical protein
VDEIATDKSAAARYQQIPEFNISFFRFHYYLPILDDL